MIVNSSDMLSSGLSRIFLTLVISVQCSFKASLVSAIFCWRYSVERFSACHGHRFSISRKSVKLRKDRIKTINPRTATFSNESATTTVRMISPAIRNSRPRMIERPNCRRNVWYATPSGNCRKVRINTTVEKHEPRMTTSTPTASMAYPDREMTSLNCMILLIQKFENLIL